MLSWYIPLKILFFSIMQCQFSATRGLQIAEIATYNADLDAWFEWKPLTGTTTSGLCACMNTAEEGTFTAAVFWHLEVTLNGMRPSTAEHSQYRHSSLQRARGERVWKADGPLAEQNQAGPVLAPVWWRSHVSSEGRLSNQSNHWRGKNNNLDQILGSKSHWHVLCFIVA